MTNNDNTITTLKSVIKTVFGMTPKELKELKSYRSEELETTYDSGKVLRNLKDRLIHNDKYDFNNLIDHLEEVESIVKEEDRSQTLRKMITIRTDDFQALVEQATDVIADEHSNILQANLTAELDHGSEIIQQLSSVSWNLNRIASHLEKDGRIPTKKQLQSDIHEKLMRKNTVELLRGKS